MALVGNGVRLSFANPMRQFGAATPGSQHLATVPGAARNSLSGEAAVSGVTDTSGVPNGYRHPGAWLQPQKAGALSSMNEVLGDGGITAANLAGGLYGEATIVGGGTISSADLRLLIIATAALAGSGAITADIQGVVTIAATALGSGDVSGTLNAVVTIAATIAGSGNVSAPIAGVLQAAATILGSGNVTNAPLAGVLIAACAIQGGGTVAADIIGAWVMGATVSGSCALTSSIRALGHAVAGIVGAGNVTAGIAAKATIGCDITSVSELSPQSLAAAVWNSLVTSFQDAGTMGEALATAGSGGLSPTQVTMLTELYRLAGLDAARPLVVTATTRDAGAEIAQSIVEAPAGTVTVTRE